jgi:hypothetical protein
MAGVVSRLPFTLSGREGANTSPFLVTGLAYDFAVGALPFLSGVSPQFPYRTSLLPIQKQQFDNSQEVGE